MVNTKDSTRFFRPIHKRRGLSLPEVMISTLLVGVLLVASMKTVGAVFRTRCVNAQLGDEKVLTEQLMSEILQARYEDPEETIVPLGDATPPPMGIDAGEANTTRADFDDVDDYDQWNQSPPTDKDGTPLPGYEGWQRKVFVQRVLSDTLQGDPNTETGLKMITVKVDSPSGDQIVLQALRSRFGAVEQPPVVDTTFVTWLEGELRSGGNPGAVNSATNVLNHAEEP